MKWKKMLRKNIPWQCGTSVQCHMQRSSPADGVISPPVSRLPCDMPVFATTSPFLL